MTQTSFRFISFVMLFVATLVSTGCSCCSPGFGWKDKCGPKLGWKDKCLGWGRRRSMAIPDTYPLGTVVRAHYHTMQTNAEAADFIMHRHEFVASSAELTPAGKDHVLEIAARMRSAPFPVLVERSMNNSDPEIDQFRRNLVAQILGDFGNPDAEQRTIVSPAYGKGLNSREAETDYYRFIFTRGLNGIGQFGNNTGQGGGAGGGIGFGP